MDKTASYFVYTPPISNSHGHGVRDKNISGATKKIIDSFIENFDAKKDDKLQLRLSFNKNAELQKANNTIDKLNGFLGLPTSEWDNAGYAYMENTVTWETKEKHILEVLDYVEQLMDDNFLPLSKYWIYCSYSYRKNSESYGYIMCSIESGRLFVRLHLIFPYAIEDERSYQLLHEFQSSLPFKLNSKHFRRLGPRKNGHGQWKLDEQTLMQVEDCLVNARAK